MQYLLMLVLLQSLSVGFSKTVDLCNLIECYDDKECVIEEGDPVCKQKINKEEKDLCSQHLCGNNENCLQKDGRAECFCVEPYRGEKCELGPCDPNPCQYGGDCRVDGIGYICTCIEGRSGDRCENDESDDTSVNPATTKSVTISSTSATTTQTAKSDTAGVSESVVEIITVTEIPKTNGSSMILSTSTSAFTKNEDIGPCNSNPCKFGGDCRVDGVGYICTCIVGRSGDRCEKDESDDTSENPATTKSVTISSTLATTTQTATSDTASVSESVVEIITVTEMPKTNGLALSSTNLPTSTSAFTKNEDRITESTKNEAKIITKVPFKDPSTISTQITSKTNKDDHNKDFTGTTSSSSMENTLAFDNKTTKTSLKTLSTIATSISSLETTSEQNQQMINGTITDNLKTSQYTTYSTVSDDAIKTSHAYSSTTESTIPTTQTPPNEPLQFTSKTSDDLSTARYTTNTEGLFHSSSRSSRHIILESSTASSTTESIADTDLETTSEKSQTEILRSTESTKRTKTVQKSTITVTSSTETSNNTSDKNDDPENAINRANISTKNAKLYGSIGASCFVATVAGWYVRRYRRRHRRPYYRGDDSSSEISANSADSNHSYA